MIGLTLLQSCAPLVAPVTMAAIVQTESGGNPWTILDNTTGQSMRFQSKAQAVAMSRILLAQGHKLDVGLAQVDSENLGWLGLGVSQIFDPCTNLQAAQRILVGAYRKAGADGVGSLKGAFEAYNSGNTSGDDRYAQTVFRSAGAIVPAIPGGHLASWAMQTIGSGATLGAGEGIGKRKMTPISLPSPVSWQPLKASEDFSSPSTTYHHAPPSPSITSIWTPAS
ncbi:lytic transglycosylase domain-containing protein [Acidithiobacillus caldus]|uniref:lytic transglycosylase domain-containing protein n=1 Tax=Acidithiobacillus caldus TaxID=33059 RepID=UPI001C06A0E2|nr:lytic transglycosylase domain-containing protein [Acidithiobacillus caldus]MBU2770134.1 lytic transglycosylase domain-containing protein [Acidithiobacillus caldus]